MKLKPHLFIVCCLIITACNNQTKHSSISEKAPVLFIENQDSILNAQQNDTLISILLAGDVMLGSSFPSLLYTVPDSVDVMPEIGNYTKNADLAFCNLEGTVSDSLEMQPRSSKTEAHNYRFKMPSKMLHFLASKGFNVVSIANNHISDFTSSGRKSTQQHLDQYGFRYAGLKTKPWDTLTVKNTKIGFTAFATDHISQNINDYQRAQQVVRFLDSLCDIVIVSFHAGGEGYKYANVPQKTEYYLGENRGDVHAFARIVIDAGADVVVGHGPHVTRAIDVYKDRFIAYSLGNFCTFGSVSIAGKGGIAPLISLKVTKDGTFHEGQIISTFQQFRKGTFIDPQQRALQEIIRLTLEDFPTHQFHFFEDGKFNWRTLLTS